jgi:hypothetical protein
MGGRGRGRGRGRGFALTVRAVNRDRPCKSKPVPEEECGGIEQQPFAFTSLVASYHG